MIALFPSNRCLWRPVRLELSDGDFPDYLASDLGLRICSARMRQVLDAFATPADALQWLPVSVAKGDADFRQYWVLHFSRPVEVLADRSIRVRDFVVKAVFRASALVGRAVFTYAGAGALPLTVNQDVKDALLSTGCTGFECVDAPVDP